jgi:hypothetical protein
MSIIREKIKYIGSNMSVKFTIGNNDDFIGYQQEIDNLTELTGNELINPVVDVEKRKYKFDISAEIVIFKFSFNGQAFFTQAGFTLDEILGNSKSFANSFFILDYYNDYNPYTQTKIFTTYITKLTNIPYYPVSSNTSQIFYWYVPESYISTQTGETSIGYVKFSFYNAKTGKITLFYNKNNAELSTPEKMYFKSELNHKNKTWKILNLIDFFAEGIDISTTSKYSERIDNTFSKFDSTTQVYPSGNSYNYKTNTYSTQK